MLFNNWEGIIRVIIMAVLGYLVIIVLLRSSGKRTLSKMNGFDFVVTITLGSMLGTIILSKDIALAEGAAGLTVLIYMQFIIAWLSNRSAKFRDMVKGKPTLLFYKGELLQEQLQKERVSPPEIYAALRAAGFTQLSEVGAVILETDGSFTTLPHSKAAMTTLEYVEMNRPDA